MTRTHRLAALAGALAALLLAPAAGAQQALRPKLEGNALVTALATMRTLHFDAVDAFMEEGGLDEALRRRVAAAAELTLVNRLVVLLGFYNNAVHYCVHYPRMRRGLAAAALELLARAKNASGFVAAYAARAIAMARDAGFRLLEWTRPE